MGRRRRKGEPIDGVLLLDKPAGITSFTAVNRARRALNAQKAGHTGTLDPMATGLLQVCFGRATRLVQFLTGLDKRYLATVQLGVQTDTYDAEGQVVSTADASDVTQGDVEAALDPFRGTITQRPPAHSAIKVDGERLYEKARRGEQVEVPTRTITIHALTLTGFRPGQVDLAVHCSKGTYIRSLAHDLGQALGVGGHLIALRRTAIGAASVDGAVTLDALESGATPELASLAEATAAMPTLTLTPDQMDAVRHGRAIAADHTAPLARALDADGGLLAILRREGAEYRVARGFSAG